MQIKTRSLPGISVFGIVGCHAPGGRMAGWKSSDGSVASLSLGCVGLVLGVVCV